MVIVFQIAMPRHLWEAKNSVGIARVDIKGLHFYVGTTFPLFYPHLTIALCVKAGNWIVAK